MSDHDLILPPDDVMLPDIKYVCENCYDAVCETHELWWASDPGCWCCEMCLRDEDSYGGISLEDWMKRVKK